MVHITEISTGVYREEYQTSNSGSLVVGAETRVVTGPSFNSNKNQAEEVRAIATDIALSLVAGALAYNHAQTLENQKLRNETENNFAQWLAENDSKEDATPKSRMKNIVCITTGITVGIVGMATLMFSSIYS